MNSRSFILSALISGVIIGLLANLPILNIINCFLCVFVWLGALGAIFIYRGFQHGTLGLTPGQGAGLGALAGLFGAFVGIFVNILTGFISQPIFNGIANYFQINGLPFQSNSWPTILLSGFFFFIIDAILYPIFGALSGLITVSVMHGGTQAKPGEVS
jgi:hypothetical protein